MKDQDQQQFVTLDTFNETLERMMGRFDTIDDKFDAIDLKFDAIDLKFNAIDRRFDAIDVRFEKIEGKLEVMSSEMATKEDIRALDAKMMDGFGAFDGKLDIIENTFIKTAKTFAAEMRRLDMAKVDIPEEKEEFTDWLARNRIVA